MVTAVVRHKIKDMAQWQQVFEENLKALWDSGCTSAKVLRAVDDPFDVSVVCEWPEFKQMRDFVTSQMDSKSAERGGVIGIPEGRILENWKEYKP